MSVGAAKKYYENAAHQMSEMFADIISCEEYPKALMAAGDA